MRQRHGRRRNLGRRSADGAGVLQAGSGENGRWVGGRCRSITCAQQVQLPGSALAHSRRHSRRSRHSGHTLGPLTFCSARYSSRRHSSDSSCGK